MLSEDPNQRQQYVDLFKEDLNDNEKIDAQKKLFELFESFPIFYFNNDSNAAERILDKIQKIMSLKKNLREMN